MPEEPGEVSIVQVTMASETFWSSEISAALAGVFVGFLLSWCNEWWTRRRRRKAHWAVLKAEIEHCGRAACGYANDDVLAPLYRLPTCAYVTAFPSLVSDGAVKQEEMRHILEYFAQVGTLNRGLNQADAARADPSKLCEEYKRNLIKAEKIRSCSDLYKRAHAVVAKNA